MRLELFSVQNFRSIERAEKLPLGDLTVLVGPNNGGKSNILQAMVIGMQELSGIRRRPKGRNLRRRGEPSRDGTAYDWERDFPRSLQETQPDGKTVMRFDLTLSLSEIDEFFSEVGNRVNDKLPITLTFAQGRPPQFQVRKQRHAEALTAKRESIAKFVAERVDIQYIEAVRTGNSVRDIVSEMLDRELAAAAADNDEYGKALDQLRQLQQPVFDSLSASITARLKSLLPEVRGVHIEDRSQDVRSTMFGRSVSVVVDDGTPTDLAFKGDGVQSLAALAMTQHYSTGRARAREFILAVEEPEAHLHPRAVHGLRDALRETAMTQQVVLTTHSPLFVNRLDLASNIIVRRNRAQPARSVQELREALGVQTADNLASAELVLVVEGPADEVALKAILAARSATLRTAMTGGVFSIHKLHGGGKLNYLLGQLRDSLAATHAFLDDDDQGKKAAQAAQEEGLLTAADVTMAMCSGASNGSEFEDLVDPALYETRFFEEFGVSIAHSWTKSLSKGKWSRRMFHVFQASGTAWTDDVSVQAKICVADEVARAPEIALKESCASVIEALVAALEFKLTERRG